MADSKWLSERTEIKADGPLASDAIKMKDKSLSMATPPPPRFRVTDPRHPAHMHWSQRTPRPCDHTPPVRRHSQAPTCRLLHRLWVPRRPSSPLWVWSPAPCVWLNLWDSGVALSCRQPIARRTITAASEKLLSIPFLCLQAPPCQSQSTCFKMGGGWIIFNVSFCSGSNSILCRNVCVC